MTTIQPPFDIMRSLSIEANDPEIDNNLSLPIAMDVNPPPMFPMSSLGSLSGLERAFSDENPLVRTYSNVSVSTDAGDAHFVPFGFNIEPEALKNMRRPFAFPDHSDQKIAPLSGPNEGNITPRILIDLVPSKAPPRLSPLQQEPDTDYESRTEHTGTSSRITPSIDQCPTGRDVDDEAECEDAAVDTELNVGAQSFVPAPAPMMGALPNYGCHGQVAPISMAPPGLSIHRGINGMNAMNQQHQQQVAVQPVGMLRNMSLNVPSLHIGPRNVVHGVQGSPARSTHLSPHRHSPALNGYSPCVDRLSPATANGLASPAGYGQSGHVHSYMGAVPQTRSPSPLVQSQGFRPHSLHRPSQSPPTPQHQVQRGGFSPHPQQQQQQQFVQRPRQNMHYGAPRTSPSDPKSKAVDVQQMIRIGATLPQLLERGLVIPFMKHQNGSRYIQERLSIAPSSLITSILKRIIFEEEEDIVALSEDIFGNYVVQIFFEQFTARNGQCDDGQSGQWVRWLIEHLLRGNAMRLSRHIYGCRVIQKAFDCIPTAQSIALIEEIKREGRKCGPSGRSQLEECITCHHGNHVVQKIITLGLPIGHIQFVVDCVATNIPLYSQHQYGCRIVQNIINLYGYEGDKRVLREVVKRDNLLKLCRSQYGNYVIQHVLKLNEQNHRKEYDEHGRPQRSGWQHCPQKYRNDKCLQIKAQVIETVFGSVEQLSKNKYGSNVVEKCLYRATETQRDLLLDAILGADTKRPANASRKNWNRGDGHGGSLLREMANHQFANYVIQHVIAECEGRQQQRMIAGIEEQIPNLRALKYGKHILEKVNKARYGGQKRYY